MEQKNIYLSREQIYANRVNDLKAKYNGNQKHNFGMFAGQMDNLETSKDVTSYYDALIYGKYPLPLFNKASKSDSKLIKTVNKRQAIGRVYSHVKESDGTLWLQLTSPNTGYKQLEYAPIIGYTPFTPEYYDISMIQNSKKKIAESRNEVVTKKADERIEANKLTNPLYSFGKGFLNKFKWLIVGVVTLLVVSAFKKVV